MNIYSNRGLHTLTALSRLGPARPNPTYNKPRPNVAVGALIVSPAAARDKLNQVNAQVTTLDTEMKLNIQRPEFLSAWGEFRDNWQKFYDDHQSTVKILLTGTGTVDRKANEYQVQLSSWYSALKTENPTAKLVFPPPLPATAPPEGPSVPWWGISLLTLAGTGALIYGTYASYVYLREARAKKRFLEEEVVPRVLRSRGLPSIPTFFSESDSMTRLHAAPSHDPGSRRSSEAALGDGQIDWGWSPSKHLAQREAERERERDSERDSDHDYDE